MGVISRLLHRRAKPDESTDDGSDVPTIDLSNRLVDLRPSEQRQAASVTRAGAAPAQETEASGETDDGGRADLEGMRVLSSSEAAAWERLHGDLDLVRWRANRAATGRSGSTKKPGDSNQPAARQVEPARQVAPPPFVVRPITAHPGNGSAETPDGRGTGVSAVTPRPVAKGKPAAKADPAPKPEPAATTDRVPVADLVGPRDRWPTTEPAPEPERAGAARRWVSRVLGAALVLGVLLVGLALARWLLDDPEPTTDQARQPAASAPPGSAEPTAVPPVRSVAPTGQELTPEQRAAALRLAAKPEADLAGDADQALQSGQVDPRLVRALNELSEEFTITGELPATGTPRQVARLTSLGTRPVGEQPITLAAARTLLADLPARVRPVIGLQEVEGETVLILTMPLR